MDEFMATVKLFAGNFAPRNWAFCHGQLLAISQNAALFSLIGTTYGGDGHTTFALPDLRGCVPLGAGHGPGHSSYEPGQTGGQESTSLSVNNMPAHTHEAHLSVSGENAGQAKATPGSTIATPGYPDGRDFKTTYGYNTSNPNVGLNENSISVGSSGGSQPFDNRQPYLAMNYIICLNGIFPPRN
jgi:microcystin-dependent protein